MALTLEELQVIITANTDNLNRQLSQIRSQLRGTQSESSRITKGISSGFAGIAAGVGGAVMAIGAVVSALKSAASAVTGFAGDCLELGSDLAEVQNVVDVTFGSMSESVNQFAKDAIASYGLSETVTKKYMGTFGAMNKAFGFTTEKSYEMAEAVTKLTGDVASFYNLSSDEAYTKLKSIWTGETESLKDLGVVMTQNALDQYALANGYGKTTAKMSEAEKVMLRYYFVQEKLSAASGDFMRTSDGWANQVRVLSLRFDSLKASIGEALIPMLTPVVQGLNTLISKIQVAVEWFNRLISAFTGKENSIGSAGVVSSQAAEALGDIGENADESADDTVKAAKKIKNALAGIDEINVLKFGDDGSDSADSSADVGSVDSIIDESAVNDTDTVLDKMAEKIKDFIDKIKAEFDRLKDLFSEGFKVGLGNGGIDMSDLTDIFESIRNGLKGIFGDGSVFDAYKGFLDKMMYGLGEIAGAFTSIGNTIGINLLGGIGKYLEQNSDYIKERLISIYESWGRIFEQMGSFAAAVADVFSVFRNDDAQQITADIIAIFGNAYLGIIDLLSRLGADILKLLTQPFIDNKDKIKEALENTLPAIENVTGAISKFVTDTFTKIFEVYDKYVKPTFENFTEGLSKITGAFVDAYNKYFAPTLGRVTERLADVYENHIQPAVDKTLGVIGKLGLRISEIFNDYIAPVISWFADIIMNDLAIKFEVFEYIATGIASAIWDFIGEVMDGISWLLDGGLGKWIADVENWIKGDWKSVWNGFSEGWESGWKALANVVGKQWNIIVGAIKLAINDMIDNLNGFNWEVPVAMKILAKETLGVELPNKVGFDIPKLAKGGIIDAPTLAMIGESGREAVVPLQNNTQGLEMLASLLESKMGGGEQPINIELTLNVGGDKVADSVVKQINRMTRAAGRTVIDIV